MSYKAIPTAQVAAYAPVTSRLLRQLRANDRGATWGLLPPCMLGTFTLGPVGYSSGSGIDSGWVSVGTLGVMVPARFGASTFGAPGVGTRLALRCWIELEQSAAANTGALQVKFQGPGADSSIHGVVATGSGPSFDSAVVVPELVDSFAAPGLYAIVVLLRLTANVTGTVTGRFRADQDGGRMSQA